VLQRHAFHACAEIDVQFTPSPALQTPVPGQNEVKRRPPPGNDQGRTSIHNQVKMKPPPDGTLIIYPDGSYHRSDKRRTGCGFVIVSGGDGADDRHALEVARGWKSLPQGSNNTAELCAGIEALKWILKFDRFAKRPILIRFDSSYAEEIALGQITPKKNLRLAQHLRQLWMKVHKERAGQVWARHVAGHSGHKWNDLADELANKGATGSSGTISASASLPLAPAAPVIAVPSDQTSAPRAAINPTTNTTVPTLSEGEESEIETSAPSSIPEQAHVYSYAQACTYPLFFGLDILCIYSGEIGGGTACAQTHHLDPKTGRLLPTDLHATPLITLPACQPISIRCAT